MDEVRSKEYSLVPSKYIKFVGHDLDIDWEKEMNRITGEIKALIEEEKESQRELENAFKAIGYSVE